MRKVLALSICLLLLPAMAVAGADLLNYEKEAQVVGRGVCDSGKTTVTLYEHQEYELYVAVTASGETYLYFETDSDEEFFVKSGNATTAMPHEAWDAKLKAAGPSWYAYMHGGQYDCREAN